MSPPSFLTFEVPCSARARFILDEWHLVRRLLFSEELARPLTLMRNPYHFCAIKGYSGLATFLHQRGLSYVEYGRPIRVAAFSGSGVAGNTPWDKGFEVTPADAALLAGTLAPGQRPACRSPLLRYLVQAAGLGRRAGAGGGGGAR